MTQKEITAEIIKIIFLIQEKRKEVTNIILKNGNISDKDKFLIIEAIMRPHSELIILESKMNRDKRAS